MQGKEEGEEGSYGVDTFGLPDEVVAVLPSDPFEQLDVARKITSIALATRVSNLESESSMLRRKLAEKEDLVDDLRRQVADFDAALSDATEKLARAGEERVSPDSSSRKWGCLAVGGGDLTPPLSCILQLGFLLSIPS